MWMRAVLVMCAVPVPMLSVTPVQSLQRQQQQQCTVMAGLDMRPDGAGVASIGNVTSPAECCGLCGTHAGCASWTVFESVCYLKPTATGTSSCDACVSGTLRNLCTLCT